MFELQWGSPWVWSLMQLRQVYINGLTYRKSN